MLSYSYKTCNVSSSDDFLFGDTPSATLRPATFRPVEISSDDNLSAGELVVQHAVCCDTRVDYFKHQFKGAYTTVYIGV